MKIKTKIAALIFSAAAFFSTVALFTIAVAPTHAENAASELFISDTDVLYPTATSASTASDPAEQDRYLYSRIGLEKDGESVFDVTRGATDKHRSVVVVIDSGVNYNHKAFLDENGVTRISERSYSVAAGRTVKEAGWDIISDVSAGGFAYHGTQVCGTIFASDRDGADIYGLAEDVELIVVKLPLSSDGAYTVPDVQAALSYALTVNPDVVNISLGSYMSTNYFGSYLKALKEGGAVVVAAAGNESRSDTHYPSSDANAVSVGAFGSLLDQAEGDASYAMATYSSYGDKNVNICAPGTFWQVFTDETGASLYKVSSGTSVASPVVASAVALYRSLYPDATPDEIIQRLYLSATDQLDYGKDYDCGYGGLNVYDFLFGEKGEVTFDSGDGTSEKVEIIEGVPLQSYPFPTTSPEGKIFGGWYLDEGLTRPLNYYTTLLKGGDVVYAKWTEEETQGVYDYTLTRSGAAVIKGYYGNASRIIVPSEIAVGNTVYAVEKIGARAFENCGADKIIVPSGVTVIDEYAFSNNSFSFVWLPSTVSSVGIYAFNNVKNTVLYLQGEDKTSDKTVFKISSDTTTWNTGATLTVAAEAGDYFYLDGIERIGTAEGYTLIAYDGNAEGLNFVDYPIVKVLNGAFSGNTTLKKIALPDVREIGASAFEGCTALVSAEFPHLETLGERSFRGCVGLTILRFPSSLAAIGASAFEGCSFLTEIDFTSCALLDSIGAYAFKDCVSLSLVDLQGAQTLTSVGDGAFYNCSSLYLAALPDGVTSMGFGTFTLCQSLIAVKLPFTGKQVGSAYSNFGYVFGASSVGLQGQAVPSALQTVYVTGTAAIGANAFDNLEGFTVFSNGGYSGTTDCAVLANGNFVMTEIYGGTVLCGLYGGAVGSGLDESAFRAAFRAPAGLCSEGIDTDGDGLADALPSTLSAQPEVVRWSLLASAESFKVVFSDYDGATIDEGVYGYGEEVAVPTAPVRSSDAQYEYVFIGWDLPVTLAVADAEYTAVYESRLRSYTVRFLDSDGVAIAEISVPYGEIPSAPEVSDREIDQTYYNQFVGWDRELTSVTQDAEYTAVYERNFVEYTVRFVYADNGVCFAEQTYHYGDTITPPATERASDARYDYAFSAWQTEFVPVTQDAEYCAVYNASYVDYVVKFVDYDGTVLSQNAYHYGETPVSPAAPERAADEEFSYTFIGWDKTVQEVTGSAVYTAVYQTNDLKVTVRFLVDGYVISSERYACGETVILPDPPVKTVNSPSYYYEFAGWTPEVTVVSESVDYVATFNRLYYSYLVRFVDYDGTPISEANYPYGATVALPENPTRTVSEDVDVCRYEFAGWDRNVATTVVGDAEYRAVYSEVGHTYLITVHEPTCTAEGYTLHVCSECGTSYTDNVTEKIPHVASDWIVDKEPEIGIAGHRYKICINCGEILEEEEIPALAASPEEPKKSGCGSNADCGVVAVCFLLAVLSALSYRWAKRRN